MQFKESLALMSLLAATGVNAASGADAGDAAIG